MCGVCPSACTNKSFLLLSRTWFLALHRVILKFAVAKSSRNLLPFAWRVPSLTRMASKRRVAYFYDGNSPPLCAQDFASLFLCRCVWVSDASTSGWPQLACGVVGVGISRKAVHRSPSCWPGFSAQSLGLRLRAVAAHYNGPVSSS